MTNSRIPHRTGGRAPGRRLLPVLALVAVVILLVAVAAAPPAGALRTGPDVAVPAGAAAPFALRAAGDVGAGAGATGSGAPWAGSAVTGYVPPVAGVDPPAGVERLFDPPEEEWGAGHRGVDLAAAVGSPVLSPGPGVVTFSGQVARRGVVVVTHPDGLRTSLEPVAASVPVGTAVAAGTVIGVVEDGSDGTPPNHCAPRSCVHWGVRRGERYIDPLSLLDRPPIVLLPDG
ncbi:M23 family metallopeptidase [Promicromonospora sp. NPDC057488]|uniref:M23 family metallopeptidase n=1 Tax=Promicromonospora sp. NPDC057488 TaxID=3346147 RepID=UPI00366E7E3D